MKCRLTPRYQAGQSISLSREIIPGRRQPRIAAITIPAVIHIADDIIGYTSDLCSTTPDNASPLTGHSECVYAHTRARVALHNTSNVSSPCYTSTVLLFFFHYFYGFLIIALAISNYRMCKPSCNTIVYMCDGDTYIQ